MKMVSQCISSRESEGVGAIREGGEVEKSLVGDSRQANGMTGVRALHPIFSESIATAK